MPTFFTYHNPDLTDVTSGEGKQNFPVNREDSVEYGNEKAAVNNNYEGNCAETLHVPDSQMIMTKGMQLVLLVVGYQLRICS